MPAKITNRATFELLRKSRYRGRSGAVGAIYVNTGKKKVEVGYAIGIKIGGAVVRNRLRRRVRAVIDELGEELAPGAYQISCGPEAELLSHEMLVRAVREACSRARAKSAG